MFFIMIIHILYGCSVGAERWLKGVQVVYWWLNIIENQWVMALMETPGLCNGVISRVIGGCSRPRLKFTP